MAGENSRNRLCGAKACGYQRMIWDFTVRRRGGPGRWLAMASVLITTMGCDGCRSRPPAPSGENGSPSEVSQALVERHNRAVALMGQFDYAGAYDQLEPLVVEHPDEGEIKVDLAIAALNRRQTGDSERAVTLLRDAIAADPSNLRAYYCLGILRLDGGDPQGALEMFARVASDDPTDGYALYYTGQCEFQLGHVETALAWYERAMQRDPYLRSCYYGAFQACLRLGQAARADEFRQDFERLEGNPQARLAEIKYSRMGPKAELQAILPQVTVPMPKPVGDVFASARSIPLADEVDVPWSRDGSAARISVVDLLNDGVLTLFLAGASANSERPNVVLQQTGERFRWIADHPLSSVPGILAAAWGDFDNDGLTDVYFGRSGAEPIVAPNGGGPVAGRDRGDLDGGRRPRNDRRAVLRCGPRWRP